MEQQQAIYCGKCRYKVSDKMAGVRAEDPCPHCGELLEPYVLIGILLPDWCAELRTAPITRM